MLDIFELQDWKRRLTKETAWIWTENEDMSYYSCPVQKIIKLKAILHNFVKIYICLNVYNRKCYRRYKQTFILLKMHAEMVENNTF